MGGHGLNSVPKLQVSDLLRVTQLLKKISAMCIALAALLVAACGSEDAPAPSPTVAPVSSAIDFKIGNNIGDRIPDFEIKLTDGTPITSAGLLQNGRPAFLFFFATT